MQDVSEPMQFSSRNGKRTRPVFSIRMFAHRAARGYSSADEPRTTDLVSNMRQQRPQVRDFPRLPAAGEYPAEDRKSARRRAVVSGGDAPLFEVPPHPARVRGGPEYP